MAIKNILNGKYIAKTKNSLTDIIQAGQKPNLYEYKVTKNITNTVNADGFTKTVAPREHGVAFSEILSFVRKHPEEAFRRVDITVDGHHIIFEGQTVDIDSLGRLLPKVLINKAHINKKLLAAKPQDSRLLNRIAQ